MNSCAKNGGASAPPFSSYLRKNLRGVFKHPPGPARVKRVLAIRRFLHQARTLSSPSWPFSLGLLTVRPCALRVAAATSRSHREWPNPELVSSLSSTRLATAEVPVCCRCGSSSVRRSEFSTSTCRDARLSQSQAGHAQCPYCSALTHNSVH